MGFTHLSPQTLTTLGGGHYYFHFTDGETQTDSNLSTATNPTKGRKRQQLMLSHLTCASQCLMDMTAALWKDSPVIPPAQTQYFLIIGPTETTLLPPLSHAPHESQGDTFRKANLIIFYNNFLGRMTNVISGKISIMMKTMKLGEMLYL